MCVVIDINSFHSVFDTSSRDYPEFEPVNRWLYTNPRSKLVYGGKRYRTQLSTLKKYLGYLAELRRQSRIAEIDDDTVDAKETELEARVRRPDFDDAYIVAIFAVSGCQVFCSKDKRADKYVKMRTLYPQGQNPPGIYRRRTHRHLLCDDNIVALRNRKR